MSINNLEELLEAMKNNNKVALDGHGEFRTDLPTFGGEAPEDTTTVWSWDESRMIVGTCSDDLRIVDREEFFADEAEDEGDDWQ